MSNQDYLDNEETGRVSFDFRGYLFKVLNLWKFVLISIGFAMVQLDDPLAVTTTNSVFVFIELIVCMVDMRSFLCHSLWGVQSLLLKFL